MSKKKLTLLLLAMTLIVLGTLAFVVAQNLTQPPAGTLTVEVNVPSGLAQPSAPACAEVFVPGKTVDIKGADFACKDPDGTVNFLTSWRCNDGKHLWQVDASSGPPAGYGFEGEPYQKAASNDVANDPGYGRAYDRCRT